MQKTTNNEQKSPGHSMLIEFSVSNFRSIWSSQKLSMVADSKRDLQDTNTFICNAKSNLKLLRSVVVYGANASGKSNVVKAIAFMRDYILKGSYETQENKTVKRQPFVFLDDSSVSPSSFEMLFIHEGTRFQYGFSMTDTHITEEWLYAFPKNKPQKWFTRELDKTSQTTTWYINPRITGEKSAWTKSTRQDALLLSTAAQLNSEQLSPVFDWFKKLKTIDHGDIVDPNFTIEQCMRNAHNKSIITNLLKAADSTISDININKISISDIEIPSSIPDELKEIILNDFKNKEPVNVKFQHSPADNKNIKSAYLPLDQESDGTRKLFSYLAPWIDTFIKGNILIVDEPESSFHPQLLAFLVSLCHDNILNEKNGQLVLATHDTFLLQKNNLLRRDQIWFIEKNENLQSRLYPLTEFHPRNNESIQIRYLKGCYGAIPFTNDIIFRIKKLNENSKIEK